MAKRYFLNQAESFTSESIWYKKTSKLKYFVQRVMKTRIQETNNVNIEARFAERKQEMNSLKTKC